MNHHLEKNCEGVDAAVFSGDVLYNDNSRAELKEYIGRWTRAIAEHERSEPEPTTEQSTVVERERLIPDGDWLWCKLMDWCKKRGTSPASHNDLFAIVGEARAARASLPPAPEPVAGWQWVPKEPTDLMEAYAENAYEDSGSAFPDWKVAYRAMLAGILPATACGERGDCWYIDGSGRTDCDLCNPYYHQNKKAALAAYPTQPRPQPLTEQESDSAHYSAQLTKAKRLIVDVWQRHPDARSLIEARTGSWFVWGDDRTEHGIKPAQEPTE